MTSYELNHRIVKDNGDIRLEEVAFGTKEEILREVLNINPVLRPDYEVSWRESSGEGYDHDNAEDWLHDQKRSIGYTEVVKIQKVAREMRDCENEETVLQELLTRAREILLEFPHSKKEYLLEKINEYLEGGEMEYRLFQDTQYVLLDIADKVKGGDL